MVVPGLVLLSAHTGTGDVMAVVIEQVGLNECISAIQVDPVSLTACLVVVDVIVVDICDGILPVVTIRMTRPTRATRCYPPRNSFTALGKITLRGNTVR